MTKSVELATGDKGRLNSDGLYQKVKKNEEQALQCLLDMGAAFDAEFLSYEQRQYLHRIHLSYMSKVIKWRRFWRSGKVLTTDGEIVLTHTELKQQTVEAAVTYLRQYEETLPTSSQKERE